MFFVRKVEENDIEVIFNWTNDPVTRSNSLSSSLISWDEHRNWFEKKLNSSDCEFFMVIGNALEPQAFVRFELKKEHWVAGIVVCPQGRGRGIGKIALKLAIEKFSKSKEIYAYIKKNNFGSQKIFELNQFELIDDKDVLLYKRVLT